MKANKKLLGLLVSGMALAGLTQSCVSDEPFANGDGEGNLRMQLIVNSDLTRAEVDEQTQALMENCVVYISKSGQGLIHKYQGSAEVPDVLPLKYGSYVAEAWTGDSVPASFTSRFYRGYKPFEIQNNGTTQVLLECKIANVVVSVDKTSIPEEMGADWNLRVFNSSPKGELVYNDATEDRAKGYFMMPKADLALNDNGEILRDDNGWEVYTNLQYELTGTTADGRSFSKKGYIAGKNFPGRNVVERAHEYVLTFRYNPDYDELGGALIDIEIDDTEIEVPVSVGLYSRPAIKGVGFEIEKQLFAKAGDFRETLIKIAGFKSLESIKLTYTDEDAAALGLPRNGVDLLKATPEIVDELNSLGIKWEEPISAGDEKPYITYVTFSEGYLNGLLDRNEEYRIKIDVTDGFGRQNEAVFRLAVGEGAVVEEDPVVVPAPESLDNLAIRAKRAVITLTASDDAQNPGLEYRVANSNDWTFVAADATRGSREYTVTLTGLVPGTAYEYRASDGDFKGQIYTFTTEKTFQIPNAGMEEWTTYGSKGWAIPGQNSTKSFWDNGNEGSSLLGKNNVCEGSTAMKHGGSYSAKLETKSIVGIALAAGNLFAGQFSKIVGTSGAEVNFGQPFEGNGHPDYLRVYANYRPKNVSADKGHLTKNQPDHGQIFVAFTTDRVTVNTANKVYFDPEASYVVGYGEKTWEGVPFGDDNTLEELLIPITWYKNAATDKPTHIVIVCCSSKYGDYLEGGAGSMLYVDDFELIYNDK